MFLTPPSAQKQFKAKDLKYVRTEMFEDVRLSIKNYLGVKNISEQCLSLSESRFRFFLEVLCAVLECDISA